MDTKASLTVYWKLTWARYVQTKLSHSSSSILILSSYLCLTMEVQSLPPESLSYTNSSINRLLLHQISLYIKIIELLETHQEHALVED